jgi:NRAMP (natural resistance-associated macrophage protein)-like metal ion transporter
MRNKKRKGHIAQGNKLILRVKKFIRVLGPGLITGASDDDPSGIATYTQAGAQFGFATLWTALLTFPLMAAIQEMCARIGIVTSKGLTGTLKQYYPRPVLWIMVIVSFPAIVLNIGADIAGMGAVSNLLIPGIHPIYFSIAFTGILLLLIIYLPYRKISKILKYLCLFLLLYLIVPFLAHPGLLTVMKHTFIPVIKFDKNFIGILVAILGTTISPYLFFWQATMEVEELKENKKQIMVNKELMKDMKKDVDYGMLFSNLVMYFIILTAAAVLFKGGIHKIDTVEQAAEALKPLAGNSAYFLFATGIIGTGMLAIPVLSGSLSYIFSEAFNWKKGLNKHFNQARPFYIIIIVSLVLGLSMNYMGISPVRALIYTSILYGITAPVMIGIILHIANNKNIMKQFTNTPRSNIFGWITLVLMSVSAIFLIYLQF